MAGAAGAVPVAPVAPEVHHLAVVHRPPPAQPDNTAATRARGLLWRLCGGFNRRTIRRLRKFHDVLMVVLRGCRLLPKQVSGAYRLLGKGTIFTNPPIFGRVMGAL